MRKLEERVLHVSLVQIFCDTVIQKTEVPWIPSILGLLQAQILQIPGCLSYIPGHWAHLIHHSFSLIWPVTQDSDLNCASWHIFYLGLFVTFSCLCHMQSAVSHWVDPTIFGFGNPYAMLQICCLWPLGPRLIIMVGWVCTNPIHL